MTVEEVTDNESIQQILDDCCCQVDYSVVRFSTRAADIPMIARPARRNIESVRVF